MPSKKKVKKSVEPVEGKILMDPVRKTYLLLAPDTVHSAATYTSDRVTVVHNESAYVQIIDTGNGYEVTDTTPVNGTVIHNIDYALAADLFAALKIFYHNAEKHNGEYWTIFEGSKL